MRKLIFGCIALAGSMTSVSVAADLPIQSIPGTIVGVPSLIGELTIRNSAGRESYIFKRGESFHFELTVRSLEEHTKKVVFPDGGGDVSFLVVTENVDAEVGITGSGASTRMATQMVREREMAPKAIEKYTGSLIKKAKQLKPGIYRVIAEFRGCLATSRQCVSVMKSFRIE